MPERLLIEHFAAALRALPGAAGDVGITLGTAMARRAGHDAHIEFRVAGIPLKLVIEAKRTVYPRDVREVLWRVRDGRQAATPAHAGQGAVTVLLADSISAGAKELLRAEGLGYFDSGGSLYLTGLGAYVYVDKPPPKLVAKAFRALFTGRRSQVVHAVLTRPREWSSGKDLAARAFVSPATASQVLTELERLEWVEVRGAGPSKERRVSQPAALLDAWAGQRQSADAPSLRRYYVPSAPPDGLTDRVSQMFTAHGARYAITHEAAAQRYAPFLSTVAQVRCRLLAGPEGDAAITDLGARAVHEGANLAVIDARSPAELLFSEERGGIWLASPILVYLDLLSDEGRAKEMAAHLRKETIGF